MINTSLPGVVAPSPSLVRRVTQSVSWLALAQIGRRVWSLVVTGVLARLLTPSDFGLIALTLLAIGVISMFAETGLTSALIQRPHVDEDHLSTAFWLNLGVNTGLALVGVALAYPLALIYREPRIAFLVMAMMLTLPLSALGQVSGMLLQKRLAFRVVAAIDSVSAFVSGMVGIVLALHSAGVWALVAQYVVLAWASSLGRAVVARWNPFWLFNRERVRDLMGFSLSVLGCSIVNYAVRNIDNALIGGALGAASLGFYSMAYNLVLMPSSAIGGLVAQVMFPALSSIQNDLPRLRGAYLRTLRMVSLAAFPFVVGMGATAPLFVQAIYGPHWQAVVPLLQILSVIGVLEAINICGIVFFALGRPNILLGWAVVSLGVMTLGFLVGVRFGAVGVAWSYVLVSPIVSIGPHILANRLLALRFSKFLEAIGPGLGAALIMGALLRLALIYWPWSAGRPWLQLLPLMLFGALVYTSSLLLVASVCGRSKRLAWLTGYYFSESSTQNVAPDVSSVAQTDYV